MNSPSGNHLTAKRPIRLLEYPRGELVMNSWMCGSIRTGNADGSDSETGGGAKAIRTIFEESQLRVTLALIDLWANSSILSFGSYSPISRSIDRMALGSGRPSTANWKYKFIVLC